MIDKNNIPVGYKDSPVGIIPQEWEVKTFGEIGIFSKGSGISRSEANTGNIPCVRYGELYTHHHNFIKIYNSFISKEVAANSKLLKYGDILFAATGETKGEIGKSVVFIDKIEAYAGGDIIIVSPDFKLSDSLYMGYLSNSISVIRQKATRGQGDAIVHITSDAIKNILIPLPPLAEQKKIAEVLSVWDDAIEKQSKLIEKLELRKRGLMQCLLSGRTRLPGFTEPWKQVKLGQIGETYTGLSGKTKEDFENGNSRYIPYINVFSNETINTKDIEIVKINVGERQNKVKFGDIFFTVSSETPDEVGMVSVLLDDVEDTYLNSFCFGYRLNDFKILEPVFASYILRGDKFRKKITTLAQGSTRFNLSKNEVMKLQIELPSLSEQQAIAEVLTSAEREIKNHRKKIEALRQQKRGLMQQLLIGKTRVKI